MRRAVDLGPLSVRRMLGIGVERGFAVEFHDESAGVAFTLYFDRIRPDILDAGNLAGHLANAVVDSLFLSVGGAISPLNGDDVDKGLRLAKLVGAVQNSRRKQPECGHGSQNNLLLTLHLSSRCWCARTAWAFFYRIASGPDTENSV